VPLSEKPSWLDKSVFARLAELGATGAAGASAPVDHASPGGPAAAGPFTPPASVWFPGIQVALARDAGGDGLVLSAKGGHNDESHSHNDVGTFILYRGGRPVIVDAGVETYTKFTFNDQRYTLWTMRSGYHNVPDLGGREQSPGRAFAARGAAFTDDGVTARFTVDIAGAYPAEAGVERFDRAFVFTRGGGIDLTDSWRFTGPPAVTLNLLCHDRPEVSAGGALLSGLVRLDFGASPFDVTVEEIPLTDAKIRADWGGQESLWRLRLAYRRPPAAGAYTLRLTPAEGTTT